MWRYRVEVLDMEATGIKALEGMLSQAGQDKWELVTTAKAFEQLVLIFKKPAS